jgi:hypothetical protein
MMDLQMFAFAPTHQLTDKRKTKKVPHFFLTDRNRLVRGRLFTQAIHTKQKISALIILDRLYFSYLLFVFFTGCLNIHLVNSTN